MEGKPNVQKIDRLVRQETLQTDLEFLCSIAKPRWNMKHFAYKKLSGGLVNNIYRCSIGDNFDDAVIVRVNSLQSVCNLVDREKELFGLQIGYAVGITEPMYIIFNNGMVYGYATGRNMAWGYLWDDHVSRSLMRCLAKLHSVDLDKVNLVNQEGKPVKIEKKYSLIERMKESVGMMPDEYKNFPERQERINKTFWPKSKFLEELETLKKHLNSFSFNVVFSHNDGWVNNILYDKEKDKLSFLDYECCDFNYEGYDMGLLFYCFHFFEHYHEYPDGMVKVSDEEMKLPRDDAFKKKLVKIYLEEKCRIQRNDPNDFSAEELEKFFVQAQMMEAVVFLYWTVFTLAQLDDPAVDSSWDIVKNTEESFIGYLKLREKLFSFKP